MDRVQQVAKLSALLIHLVILLLMMENGRNMAKNLVSMLYFLS
jgi:hypothetical protein